MLSATEIRATAAHPFYARLNELLESNGFDPFVEEQCQRFYAGKMGRPSLTPGPTFALGGVGKRELVWFQRKCPGSLHYILSWGGSAMGADISRGRGCLGSTILSW